MGRRPKIKEGQSKYRLLSDLVDMTDADAVCREVKQIVSIMYPNAKSDLFNEVFNKVFDDVVSLFRGTFTGYRSCNTEYHDLKHTTDTLLASARLIHGASIKRINLSEETVMLALISALMHDAGYIQTVDDLTGTGAKYTLSHVERSVEFMKKYFTRKGYPKEYIETCSCIIRCTGMNTRLEDINFPSDEVAVVGKMMGTADLLGQMADRVYLEKLLFLFYEFQEGMIKKFGSELDLLRKTLKFYEYTELRLSQELGAMTKYLRYHFKERWNIDSNLYEVAVKNNISYLRLILEKYDQDYRCFLKRGGIVNKLQYPR